MPFAFKRLAIPDVIAVQPKAFSDDRGSFSEMYRLSSFREAGVPEKFVQFNRSINKQNVLRGLHYQLPPVAQGKLVRAAVGRIFDVAVDIRRDSSHYGRWVSATLSAEEGNLLYVPAGFAHGFCVLSKGAEMMYYCTAEYAPDLERGIVWDDPDIGIAWPIKEPKLSSRDQAFPSFRDAELLPSDGY